MSDPKDGDTSTAADKSEICPEASDSVIFRNLENFTAKNDSVVR
jgi:hypothetical protein